MNDQNFCIHKMSMIRPHLTNIIYKPYPGTYNTFDNKWSNFAKNSRNQLILAIL